MLTSKFSSSGWVRSADGANIQKKLWDETLNQLQSETDFEPGVYI